MTNSHTYKVLCKNVLLNRAAVKPRHSAPDTVAPLQTRRTLFIAFQYTAKLDTTPQISTNKEWRRICRCMVPCYTYNFREMWKYRFS